VGRPLRRLGLVCHYQCRDSLPGLPHKAARVDRSPRYPRTRASLRRSCLPRRASRGSCPRARRRHRRSWVHSLQVSSHSPRASSPLLPSRRVSSHHWPHNRRVSSHPWPRNRRVSSQTLPRSRQVSNHRSLRSLQATAAEGRRLEQASLAPCHPCRPSLGLSRMGRLASYSPVSPLWSSVHGVTDFQPSFFSAEPTGFNPGFGQQPSYGNGNGFVGSAAPPLPGGGSAPPQQNQTNPANVFAAMKAGTFANDSAPQSAGEAFLHAVDRGRAS
jgi:hypothetical protein